MGPHLTMAFADLRASSPRQAGGEALPRAFWRDLLCFSHAANCVNDKGMWSLYARCTQHPGWHLTACRLPII